jgi:hypothetical protein
MLQLAASGLPLVSLRVSVADDGAGGGAPGPVGGSGAQAGGLAVVAGPGELAPAAAPIAAAQVTRERRRCRGPKGAIHGLFLGGVRHGLS